MLPEFLIPGAGKSGTSSLCHYLDQHPEICIPYNKEPAFFSRMPQRGKYSEGISWYKNYFESCDSKLRGEASTIYMYEPDSAELIAKQNSNIKLIFLLREPISRAYSNYWQDIKGGRALPDFGEMIEDVDLGDAERFTYNIFDLNERGNSYIYLSNYVLHIERYLNFFPKSSMLFLKTEQLKNNREDTLEKVFKFLGVDSEFKPEDLTKKNVSKKPRIRFFESILHGKIKQIIPFKYSDVVRKPLLKLVEFIRRLNLKEFDYPPIDSESEYFLAKYFLPQMSELENLTNLDLKKWKNYHTRVIEENE